MKEEFDTSSWNLRTNLTGDFWNPLGDRLAEVLSVFAMGHHDQEVRELATKLFEKLFVIGRTANNQSIGTTQVLS
jgi:hypothetical protein